MHSLPMAQLTAGSRIQFVAEEEVVKKAKLPHQNRLDFQPSDAKEAVLAKESHGNRVFLPTNEHLES